MAGVGIEGGMHSDNFGGDARAGCCIERTMSTLLADLQATGLLGETPVLLGTEFGRTPPDQQQRRAGP